MQTTLENLADRLQSLGMTVLGTCPIRPEDQSIAAFPQSTTIVLIGNAGSRMWQCFARDKNSLPQKNPLDIWTEEKLRPIADEIGAGIVFPFGGPPWHPFSRWAVRTRSLSPSPLGLTIHPEYGLWHAFRAAFLCHGDHSDTGAFAAPPCETCQDQPCLSACPVDAFTATGFDVANCRNHVRNPAGQACATGGCLARHACPIGQDYAYEPAHATFHMAAYARKAAN